MTTFSTLRTRIGRHIGLSSSATNYTSDESQLIDDIIQSGLSRFYTSHDWRFLKPAASITLHPSIYGTIYSATLGVITACKDITVSSVTETTLTVSTNTWTTDDWVGMYITDSTKAYYWEIISNTSDTLTVNSGDRDLTDLISASATAYISPQWVNEELVNRSITINDGDKEWTITDNTVDT